MSQVQPQGPSRAMTSCATRMFTRSCHGVDCMYHGCAYSCVRRPRCLRKALGSHVRREVKDVLWTRVASAPVSFAVFPKL